MPNTLANEMRAEARVRILVMMAMVEMIKATMTEPVVTRRTILSKDFLMTMMATPIATMTKNQIMRVALEETNPVILAMAMAILGARVNRLNVKSAVDQESLAKTVTTETMGMMVTTAKTKTKAMKRAKMSLRTITSLS